MEAIELASGETVVASGAAEAHSLGLITQVPTREIYLTSGPSRRLKLGNREVELKHGNRWQCCWANALQVKPFVRSFGSGPNRHPWSWKC